MSWAQQVLARRDLWGLAPSAHNTQPWLVTADGDRIVVGWDEQRHLADGDPTRRDLLLSLGCVVETLAITAGDLGHSVDVAWDVAVETRRAATLFLRDRSPAQAFADGQGSRAAATVVGSRSSPPAELVRARRTARSAYRTTLTATDIDRLAADARLPDGIDLQVVPAPWVRRWLPAADEWALAGPAADELSSWLRLSPRDPRYNEDGLTDKTLGLSRIEAIGLRVALRPGVRRVLRWSRLIRVIATRATAKPTGTIVALVGPRGLDLPEIGALGQTLMRLWLQIQRRGWSAHPLSALLDCPASAAAWGHGPHWTSGRDVDQVPYAVMRLGVPDQPPPRSARR